jgi:tetratricopeptide (TPR) repeat protein
MKNVRTCAGVFFMGVALAGCTMLVPQTAVMRDTWPEALPQRAEITETPFFPQDEYQCGPAALATVLAHFGAPVTAEDLVTQVYIPARQGSIQVEMLAAARRHGKVAYVLAPRYDDVLREIAAGTPVIVLQNYGAAPDDLWHYAVAIGYDRHAGELILRSGEKRRHTMLFPLFEYTWKPSAYWAMVAMPPDRIPVTADPERYLEAIVALEASGQPRAAAAAYVHYLERWPDVLTAQVGLANAYYALGELAHAEAVLRRALASHPESVVAANNLAHTLSLSGRGAEALELIERFRGANSPHAAAVDRTRAAIIERMKQQN